MNACCEERASRESCWEPPAAPGAAEPAGGLGAWARFRRERENEASRATKIRWRDEEAL
jgi:hypothetical protein